MPYIYFGVLLQGYSSGISAQGDIWKLSGVSAIAIPYIKTHYLSDYDKR
ncbi:hypothetical protein [Pontibacter ramchanderi]|uniref:Uncharacterized protein n=1 Tax=Pontibacter ramchanderi TaxID=1179743 RepID=A0A2N3U9E0_9BACT|nr:hypothetical protein [Pontibacter ramchanderi]PKV63373.1 hypothetical protein BD749_3215 [Pontibacter ramchanderi]